MAQKCQIPWVKNWSKVESKIGPCMLRNIIGSIFDSKNGHFWPSLGARFLRNFLFAAEKRRFSKTKKQKERKNWTNFWLKKDKNWNRREVSTFTYHIQRTHRMRWLRGLEKGVQWGIPRFKWTWLGERGWNMAQKHKKEGHNFVFLLQKHVYKMQLGPMIGLWCFSDPNTA